MSGPRPGPEKGRTGMRTIARTPAGAQAQGGDGSDYVVTGRNEWRRAFVWWGHCARLDLPCVHLSRRVRRATITYDLYTTDDELSAMAVEALANAFDAAGVAWRCGAVAGHVRGVALDEAETLAARIVDIIGRNRHQAGCAVAGRPHGKPAGLAIASVGSPFDSLALGRAVRVR